MRARSTSILLIAILALAVPGPARSAGTGKPADSFEYVSKDLGDWTEVDLAFSWDSPPTTSSSDLLVVEFSGPDGIPGITDYEASSGGTDFAVQTRQGEDRQTIVDAGDGWLYHGTSYRVHAFGFGGLDKLRVAAVGWGTTIHMDVKVDGTDVPVSLGDPSRAFVASKMDFGGGFAAAASGTDAAVMSTLNRVSHDHLLALFAPATLGAGIASVDGPQGEHFDLYQGQGYITIGRDTDGPWSYSMTAAADAALTGGGAVLWSVELP